MVTKEVDSRVAKAYIALADDPEIADELIGKQKEDSEMRWSPTASTAGPSNGNLESRAIDMYLEDEEWEQNALGTSGPPPIPQFPLAPRPSSSSSAASAKVKWWPWKS